MRSNQNAVNFRLLRTPDHQPGVWAEVLAHKEDVTLEGMDGFREHLAITERATGLRRVRILHTPAMAEHLVPFDEPVYTLYPERNEEYDTSKLRFLYTSLVTPRTVYDYDMSTGDVYRKRSLLVSYSSLRSGYRV